nr:MAG TPA: DNA primase small subunit [Caudoviricetes sp.]
MDMQGIKYIEKLMTLFRGSSKAHGVYTQVLDKDPLKKKVKGKALTISMAPTLKKWIEHVEGRVGLGIIPINEENRCWWGVLDIDGEVDHISLQKRIQALELPLVECYSKSKSAHCFLFLENPTDAESIRSILEEMASKLGVAGCEIFPKQNTLNVEKGDLGNWLNMPYFNNTRKGVRLCDGKLEELDLPEFLEYAYSKRLSQEDWNKLIGHIQKSIDELETVLEGAPPCIQYILKTQGICEGTRNKLMYNIAIYCKKKYPEDIFADKVKEIHDQFAQDPLSIKELNQIIDSVKGKEYRYQCKDGMLKQFCNSSICVERENGIDFSTEIKTIKNATRILTTPPIYAVEVELESERPSKVYVTTDQLFRQDLFRKECSEQLHKTFLPLSAKQWNQMSTSIINNAINQDPPYDMMEESQLYFALIDYLANRLQGTPIALEQEEGVYHNKNEHQIYFKLSGFRSYLIRRGMFDKNLTNWKLGNKLNALYVPTDEVDFKSETSVKRQIKIDSATLRVRGKVEYLRRVAEEEVPKAEELRDSIEGVL